MKHLNSKILESIQRGINLAIDDIDDVSIEYQKKSKVTDNIHTKELLQWVDLGLPSGTLWAKYNYGVDQYHLNSVKDWYGNYYTWNEASALKNYALPTLDDIEELKIYTTWDWVHNYNDIQYLDGCVFTGKNGNFIFLPAAGFHKDSVKYRDGYTCYIWTS